MLPYTQTDFWLKVCKTTTLISNTGRQHSVGECKGIWNYPHFPTSVCTQDSVSFLRTFSRYEKMKQIWWPKFTIFLLEVNRINNFFIFKVHSRNIKDSTGRWYLFSMLPASRVIHYFFGLDAFSSHLPLQNGATIICNKKGIKQGILAGKYTWSPFPLATSAKISIYYL